MKKNRSWNSILLATVVGVGMVSLALPAAAKVGGQCANCHTMHNSQNGAAMNVDGSTVANDVLLTQGCVACHTGENIGGTAATGVMPYVNSTGAPTYGTDGTAGANTLAGGSFYWVAGGAADATGHNVGTDSLAGGDGALANLPPGGTDLGSQLTCAGTTGCHGDRSKTNDFAAISGTHHADDSTIDGATVATSFRFLDGVLGLEDPAWEFQPTASLHNQYKGVDRTDESTVTTIVTISDLCAACHQSFHDGAGSVEGSGGWGSPWIRHPTDFDMGNTQDPSEYRAYGDPTGNLTGAGTNAYVVSAPVASANVDTVLSAVNLTGVGNDEAIVTCISCHRAHGTPNDDLLRWNYNLVVAGAGGTNTDGCFECHTTKN